MLDLLDGTCHIPQATLYAPGFSELINLLFFQAKAGKGKPPPKGKASAGKGKDSASSVTVKGPAPVTPPDVEDIDPGWVNP